VSYPPPAEQDPYQPLPPYTPQYLPPQPAQGPNGLAIASMVTGIVSLVLFCCTVLSVPTGITGVVLGVVSLNQISRSGQPNKGMAVAGIACGAAALLVQAAWLIFNGFAMLSGTELWSD
jgi:Domain of unknown function (DUF4190)